jgi:glycosyltransferase involved in cell wall biosynthesis
MDPIEPFLDELDILVVATTRGEGFATIALEALAAGVLVVAAAAGGIVEVVDDTCGAVVTDATSANIAEAIARLSRELDADPNSMRQSAIRRASRWSLEASAEALLACWTDASTSERRR